MTDQAPTVVKQGSDDVHLKQARKSKNPKEPDDVQGAQQEMVVSVVVPPTWHNQNQSLHEPSSISKLESFFSIRLTEVTATPDRLLGIRPYPEMP